MSDLDKFKNFLDKMRIGYEVNLCADLTYEIDIDSKYIYQSYDNRVGIDFNENQSFKEFEAWGE